MFEETLQLVLDDVQPYTVHGSLYYQITYHTEDDTTPRQLRINPEAFYRDPQPGDCVEATFLMGNLMGAQKRPLL